MEDKKLSVVSGMIRNYNHSPRERSTIITQPMKKARRASKTKAASSKSRPRTASKVKTAKPAKRVSKPRALSRTPNRIAGTLTNRNQTIVIEPLSVLHPDIPSDQVINDLPFSYNETKLVLMVRDPLWAYAYWDFSADSWN
jgi:hypothetical protein